MTALQYSLKRISCQFEIRISIVKTLEYHNMVFS